MRPPTFDTPTKENITPSSYRKTSPAGLQQQNSSSFVPPRRTLSHVRTHTPSATDTCLRRLTHRRADASQGKPYKFISHDIIHQYDEGRRRSSLFGNATNVWDTTSSCSRIRSGNLRRMALSESLRGRHAEPRTVSDNRGWREEGAAVDAVGVLIRMVDMGERKKSVYKKYDCVLFCSASPNRLHHFLHVQPCPSAVRSFSARLCTDSVEAVDDVFLLLIMSRFQTGSIGSWSFFWYSRLFAVLLFSARRRRCLCAVRVGSRVVTIWQQGPFEQRTG